MNWRNSLASRSRVLFAADTIVDGDDGTVTGGVGADAGADAVSILHCDMASLPPDPTQSQIVEVGFADLPEQKSLFGGTRKQYVNLPHGSRRKIVAADAEIASANQIGPHPPIYVRVTPAQLTTVRLKLTRTLTRGGFPAGSATLSARERGLAHLHWAWAESTHSTDENGELLLEPGLHISALGGGEFHVQAALAGQGFVNSSNAVQVKRRVYLRPVLRYHAGRDVALGAMRGIRRQLESLGIEVKQVQSSTGGELGVHEASPEDLVTVGQRALNSNTQHVRNFQPHSVAVIVGEFTNDDAIPMVTFRRDVARDAAGNFPASVTLQLSLARETYVVVPLSDRSQFGDATLRSAAHVELLDMADLSGLDRFSKTVRVNLARVSAAFGAAPGFEVIVRLKAIKAWAVGWAYTTHPVIYLNMRNPDTDHLLAADQAEALMIHELGHKLHLAASGAAGQPDAQAHYYPSFNHGVSHTGPHCSQGVPAGTDLWLDAAHDASTCTMWGSLKTITTYCAECRTTLRKVDLGAGF